MTWDSKIESVVPGAPSTPGLPSRPGNPGRPGAPGSPRSPFCGVCNDRPANQQVNQLINKSIEVVLITELHQG